MLPSFLRFALAAVAFGAVVTLTACEADDDDPVPSNIAETTDGDLYVAARDTAGFRWFGFSDSLRAKSSGSGHLTPWLRTRYNALAAGQLDPATGRVRTGAVFPAGSLIVKELHAARTGPPAEYAIIRKDPTHPLAASGWVWTIVKADGTPVAGESAINKGVGCVSCHAQADNIDATLMNKFF